MEEIQETVRACNFCIAVTLKKKKKIMVVVVVVVVITVIKKLQFKRFVYISTTVATSHNSIDCKKIKRRY